MTKLLPACLLGLAGFIAIQPAKADLLTITGNLTSDGASVGSGDPVITDPATINLGDPFSLSLTYNPASATHSGRYLQPGVRRTGDGVVRFIGSQAGGLRGEKTLSQLRSQYKVHPMQIAKRPKSALA